MQFNQVELQLPAQKYKQNQMDEGEKIYQNGTPSINDNYYEGKDEDQFGVDQNGDSEQEKSTSKATPDNMSKSESIIEVNPSNKKQAKSSTMYAYMNLFKGYIGSGILALPYAFTQAGWVLSSMIFLLVAFIVYDTMNLLFELADSYGKEGVDYQFIAKHHFGRKGQFAVSTFIVIFQVGCCISYVIFFMKFLENVFGMAGKTQENDIIYLLIALAIIIPMSFINSISAFAKISILANFMIVVTLLAIFSVIKYIFNYHKCTTCQNRTIQHKLVNQTLINDLISKKNKSLILNNKIFYQVVWPNQSQIQIFIWNVFN